MYGEPTNGPGRTGLHQTRGQAQTVHRVYNDWKLSEKETWSVLVFRHRTIFQRVALLCEGRKLWVKIAVPVQKNAHFVKVHKQLSPRNPQPNLRPKRKNQMSLSDFEWLDENKSESSGCNLMRTCPDRKCDETKSDCQECIKDADDAIAWASSNPSD